MKDIAFLLHEPMLKKIREIAAHEKKIKRALAKKNRSLAKKISSRRPEYRLDHLVKERYPSLMDALRDLDDPLAMVHLFAVLPSDQMKGIPADRVQLSRRLALEWQAYVVASHTLRKSFCQRQGLLLSGQRSKGRTVTWMVPHQVSQVLPPDVDFKVMMTFLEFYQSMLQFVMFSLYAEMGIHYPPNVDDAVDEAGILSIGNTAKMIEEVRKGEADGVAVRKIQGKIQELERQIQGMGGDSGQRRRQCRRRRPAARAGCGLGRRWERETNRNLDRVAALTPMMTKIPTTMISPCTAHRPRTTTGTRPTTSCRAPMPPILPW